MIQCLPKFFRLGWRTTRQAGLHRPTLYDSHCNFSLRSTDLTYYFIPQALKYPLKPSCSLRINQAQMWMRDSALAVNLINKAMELIHPQLFSSSMAVRDELRKGALTKDLASEWESVYTAVSVIINRTTKEHRDCGGEPGWYDFLLTLGNHSYTTLDFPELGVQLMYNPGTAVAFCANALRHSVPAWGWGDRICYAFFNKKVVMERFGRVEAGWMMLTDLTFLQK